MIKRFLNKFHSEQLEELRWAVYWENGARLEKLWFDWADKQGIIKTMFELLGDLDSFNRWDVEREIERRSPLLLPKK